MTEITVERDLYPYVKHYLALNFEKLLQRRAGGGKPVIFLDDVSTASGTEDGVWSRPDMAAVAFTRGRYIPFFRADLHTFEIKTVRGLDLKGAHEAAAHQSLGHFSWLVFQSSGRTARSTELFERMLNATNTLGVGMITFKCPSTPSEWYVDAWPRRTHTDDAVADAFIGERFNDWEKNRIQDYMSGIRDIRDSE